MFHALVGPADVVQENLHLLIDNLDLVYKGSQTEVVELVLSYAPVNLLVTLLVQDTNDAITAEKLVAV